jgi:Skp family chaperone for outer membrane proteins
MIIIWPHTQIISFSNFSFASGTGGATTSTSTAVNFDVGGPIVAQTIWSKRKYYELMDELEQEKAARQAAMTPLQRIDDDLAALDAQLASVPENLRGEYAANARRAELLKERAAAEKDQRVRELADEIRARRAIDALKR